MERVAFIVEETGERLRCMLNPESLLIRRCTGLKQRESMGGFITGSDMADAPLLHTNGGHSELQLDLLFDVALPGSSIATQDVRDLTKPLWNLSENAVSSTSEFKVPLCRFVWGKQWNITGVITKIAERLESFTSLGQPRRSWIRLILRRVVDKPVVALDTIRASSLLTDVEAEQLAPVETVQDIEGKTGDQTVSQTTVIAGERIEQIAYRLYGDVRLWRCIALHNDIYDPLGIMSGEELDVPGLL